MSVSILRFSPALSVALVALFALAGVTVAQEDKPKSEAANASNEGVLSTRFNFPVRHAIQTRLQLSEQVKAELEGALRTTLWDANEIDSSLISNYWVGVQCEVAGSTSITPKDIPDAELTVHGGMKILAVTEGGAAEESGLEKGDVLLSFAGKNMNSLNDLYAVIGETKDSEASMLVVRKKELITLQITPQERPKEEEEAVELDARLHYPGLSTIEDAFNQEMQGKQLPEGYRLQFELVRGKDVTLKVTKGDETWNVDGDSTDELPEPIQEVASGIVEACEPMVALDRRDFKFVMEWQGAGTPIFRLPHLMPHQMPLFDSGNGKGQLDDLRREIKRLSEAVTKLKEKLDD